MVQPLILGIDLGTTNSLGAYMSPSGPVVIRDAAGNGLVYNPGQRVFGTTTPLYTLLLAAATTAARGAPDRAALDAASTTKPWAPAAVFDDGAHCFIKLPAAASHREAPVLFTVAADGTKLLLNYTLSGDTYITDRTFRTGILVIGEGQHQYMVRIENRRYDASDVADAASVARDH